MVVILNIFYDVVVEFMKLLFSSELSPIGVGDINVAPENGDYGQL